MVGKERSHLQFNSRLGKLVPNQRVFRKGLSVILRLLDILDELIEDGVKTYGNEHLVSFRAYCLHHVIKALVLFSHHPVFGDLHIVIKDLVGPFTRHGPQRPNGDTRAVHIHNEQADSLIFRYFRVEVRPCGKPVILRIMTLRVKGFLAAYNEAVVLFFCPHLH